MFVTGEYFGELALISGEPRYATMKAKGVAVCVSIEKVAFESLHGPVKEILKRNADNYKKYFSEAALVKSVAEMDTDGDGVITHYPLLFFPTPNCQFV